MDQQLKTSEIYKGIGVGLFDAGKDTVVGLYEMAMDPLGTIDSTINAILHPIDTVSLVSQAIRDSFERDVLNGMSIPGHIGCPMRLEMLD
ncbi:hypothetical protein ABES38_04225 [Bacillus gobiensis]|uniref:hypothetical protein n=1 Tax=Bacillus gobiensis TaxID=1441095 RepID=UPI003D1A3599